ncbi:MAG: TerB family tellurite resistance protein [Pseudomonadota bacterium]
MWTKLKDMFAAGQPAAASSGADDATAQHAAAAALLAEAGLADGDFDPTERRLAAAALARVYGLDAAAAESLIAEGERAAEAALGQHRFTRALVDATTVKERADFLTEVWRVVLADGKRDPQEDVYMRRLAGLLHVPDRESGVARRRAEQSD